MTVSTTSAAIHITPVALKTLYKHTQTKGRKLREGDKTEVATDNVFFDEAFHIVKAFIDMGTHNTIESLQSFTNTHVPAPPWAAVSPVLIPLQSCNKAADLLIEWFGPEELKTVVGGEKWWQVRGLDGVDAEWITQKSFLSDQEIDIGRKLSSDDEDILRMDHLERVMLYVHGGAYFWGSINTHRYQIIRYARKMKGRAFAVNYRKAPQYPWPCPVQDVIAAYLYLTNPPEGALHKAIPPSKIVLAGDSAGAGLCVSVLTVLRDLGIEQPAGAVLISPWVDLTHSFPSVMKNTSTDIIPPYGFIHKPSPIWPVDLLPKPGDARVVKTQNNPPPMPGHADTLRPSTERISEQLEQRTDQGREEERGEPVAAGELQDEVVKSQEEMLNMGSGNDKAAPDSSNSEASNAENGKKVETEDKNKNQENLQKDTNGAHAGSDSDSEWTTLRSEVKELHEDDPSYDDALSFWEPKPPKVLMQSPADIPLELHAQIQMYATNEQISHPLVSPVLQASLGNLCPLYIIAGDGEVLRDEIIYLAHKAAHPKDYPTRKGVLREGRRQRENAEKFTTPTKVHLQVFDGMCHVLTVFIFTDSAKYAYRSIAEFVKHVTSNSADHIARNPFPELHRPPSDISDSSSDEEGDWPRPDHKKTPSSSSSSGLFGFLKKESRSSSSPADSHQDVRLYKANEEKTKIEVKEGTAEVASNGATTPASSSERSGNGDSEGSVKTSDSPQRDIPNVVMIRERIDIFGRVRPMEAKEEMEVLRIPPRQIGIIKEEPVKRWLSGQEAWDKQYRRAALKAMKKRVSYERNYVKLMERARAQGLELHSDATGPRPSAPRGASASSRISVGEIMVNRRWGPFDVEGEQPAPTAIVGRRDNYDAIALVKNSIYFSAPVTHRRVPKRTAGDTFRAAFDPEDNLTKGPRQSEQQTESHAIPGMHGLHIWQSLVTYFMKKSSKKAADGKRRAQSAVHDTSAHMSDKAQASS